MTFALAFAHNIRSFRIWLCLLATLVAVSSGCEVMLISTYDQQIDDSATTLQREMDAFLTKIETNAGKPEAAYGTPENQQFYQDYLVSLRAVRVRAESHPKNDITVRQINLLIDSVGQLRQQHEAGPLAPALIPVNRDLFAQGWRAIITLELAKKRGDD